MGKVRTIARRSFLIGSAAIVGGVAFGTYMVKRDPNNPLSDGLPDAAATFNPWVKIDGEKITLVTPHADIGQGVVSLQAALIAEEMDVAWDGFETSFGDPSAAYWNTAMASEAAPFLPWDDGLAARSARAAMGSLFKVIGVQGTGGSSTTPDTYVKLREAGAIARETLKLAASKRTGIAVSELITENSAVVLPDGKSIKYIELAAEAAQIEPVKTPQLRDPSTWRYIGKELKRIDTIAKSTGTQDYGIDIKVPGMVYASVRTNPRRSGSPKTINSSAAEKMRGVEKIVSLNNGFAAIADNSWRAIQAVNAVEVEWNAAPYPAEQEGHWKACAASFVDERLDSEWRNIGDIASVSENAKTKEVEYRAPYVAHQPLEPLNAIVLVTDEQVEVWTGHQMPRFVQQQVAAVSGHEAEQVILHNQYSGGSFGHRLEFDFLKQATEIANQMRGTPVKMIFSREEDFAQDFNRQIGMSKGSGIVKNGKVAGYDIQVATVSSSRSQGERIGLAPPGADSQIVSGVWNQPYGFDQHRVRAYAVPELAPTSSWRSVGASTGGFFSEGLLDELIHEAGADPLEERIRLCTLDEVSKKALEAVGEMSSWGSKLGPNQGRGVALVHSFGVPCAEVIEVTMTADGIKIDKVFVAADVGKVIDPVNFENQVQGGVVWGLGHAMNCEITFLDGMVEQTNYHAHEGMRLYQCPIIEVRGLENGAIRGVGEPPVPPVAPALANAIFAATGKRIREMPFNKHIDFV